MAADKVALFAFTGEGPCFVHVLLNAFDLKERGFEVRIVIEGAATRLVKELDGAEGILPQLYERAKREGLVDCVCQACAKQMSSLESAKAQELALCHEMSGHPSMGRYLEEGYRVITI